LPDGALLSALIVALILDPHERWYVPVATAALAICSKYIARTREANILNPAAVALVASYFLFDSGQSWWGALPDLPPVFLLVLLGTGLFIANHVNKLPAVLVFAGSYFALFTLAAFLGDPARVAEIYRVPQINATIFLACFMLTDPPTSPVRYRDQVWFGLLVAALSVATYLTFGGEYYLLAGLLVGNVAEAGRRVSLRQRRVSLRARPVL
jgi:Na+-transporting NADH:ubiquinone oxidoreductase subunit NqrB